MSDRFLKTFACAVHHIDAELSADNIMHISPRCHGYFWSLTSPAVVWSCVLKLLFVFKVCKQIWLGLYDDRTSSVPDFREPQKVKEFLQEKYEKKRW